MSLYPKDYSLTQQEIDELRIDAKQASKAMTALMNFKMEERYSYQVEWSAEDEQYVGSCKEFFSLSWLDADRDKARLGIEKLVFEVVQDMAANGEKIP